MLTFLLGQPIVQVIQMVTGLALVWFLQPNEYGMYATAFAIQTGLSAISNTGISVSLTSLIGTRHVNPKIVQGYYSAAIRIRRWLYVIAACTALVAFPVLTLKHDWGISTKSMLLAGMLATLYFQQLSISNTILLLKKDVKGYFNGLLLFQIVRIAIVLCLWSLGLISAVGAIWASTASTALHDIYVKRRASKYTHKVVNTPPLVKRLVYRLSTYAPGTILNSIQGQLLIFILLLVGSTTDVASLAALGRLGALFAILSASNGVLLGPWIARKSKSQIYSAHAKAIVVLSAFAGLLAIIGWLIGPYLLPMLGSSYKSYRLGASLALVAGSASYLEGATWTLNASRGISYYWYNTGIPIIRIVSISIGAVFFDLSRVDDLLLLSIVSTLILIAFNLVATGYHYAQHKRSRQKGLLLNYAAANPS